MMRHARAHAVGLLAGLAGGLAMGMGGCAAGLSPRVVELGERGEYGRAALAVQAQRERDANGNDRILHDARLLALALADGQAQAATFTSERLFQGLREQGVNADLAGASAVLGEGVRVWKGEPFEQAWCFAAIAVQHAMIEDWENARAASLNALFRLRDFSQAIGKPEPTVADLLERAQTLEREREGAGAALIDNGYVATQSDFALGYLLCAIANQRLGRADEASDNLAAAARANPRLEGLVERLRGGGYNTLLVVEAGLGPVKRRFEQDGAVAEWSPRQRAADEVVVRVEGQDSEGGTVWPLVQDYNAMARSLRWRGMEDLNVLKSRLGDALLLGGVIVAGGADGRNQDTQRAIGLGLAGLGLLLKATSQADVRFLEFLPAGAYVVPLSLDAQRRDVRLRVGDDTLVLRSMQAPPGGGGGLAVRLVRMPATRLAGAVRERERSGEAWWRGGPVHAAGDGWDGPIAGDDTLPYIFGGACVRTPSSAVLERYQRAGRLLGMTTVDLENLYRAEGIALRVEDQRGLLRRHVLEGGDTLVSPMDGTAGWQRIFGRPARVYEPRSEELREAVARERTRGGGTR